MKMEDKEEKDDRLLRLGKETLWSPPSVVSTPLSSKGKAVSGNGSQKEVLKQ